MFFNTQNGSRQAIILQRVIKLTKQDLQIFSIFVIFPTEIENYCLCNYNNG